MRIGIRGFVESDTEIQKRILTALAEALDDALKKASPNIRARLITLLIYHIERTPEYIALVHPKGELRKEFGIDAVIKVERIVDIWANSVQVSRKPIKVRGSKLTGSLEIFAVKSDYDDVLNSDDAWQKTREGQLLPWLEWLLLLGDKKIVASYEVKFGNYPRSRSGGAIMVESKESWGVPAAFAGTQNDNWVTRAIQHIKEEDVIKIIREEIERVL